MRQAKTALSARTVALDSPPDLLGFCSAGSSPLLWQDERGGLAGRGVAMRIELTGGLGARGAAEQVMSALAEIGSDDEVGLPGCGPVAIGALPFDPGAPASLVVPAELVGRRDRSCWHTVIEGAPQAGGEEVLHQGDPSPDGRAIRAALRPGAWVPAGPEAGGPPDRFTLAASMPHESWRRLVSETVSRLSSEGLDKVVLARRVDVSANRPFLLPDVLHRLAALYPSCMLFCVEGFLGASPELLLSRSGRQVASHPLAGTAARSGDAAADEALVAALMSSQKERWEHGLVVEAIASALRPLCEELIVPERPAVLGLRNVSHLGTLISGRLSGSSLPSALDLVARISPTPAVAGAPAAAAMELIRSIEGFDRGRYAGPVGWVDSHGDGQWALGIRCAEVQGATARLYAGAGIVAGSDPAAELAETQLKLQAMLAALVRP